MQEYAYDRTAAVGYAVKWALSRNPRYYDFEKLGGDCTNFASQCILAGAGIMNYTPTVGWYYITADDRSAAWTGVEYLYRFLISNSGVGPYAEEVPASRAEPGDIVQLGDTSGHFYHSPVITAVTPRILVAAHTFDALDRPLDTYAYGRVRFLHVAGVRR